MFGMLVCMLLIVPWLATLFGSMLALRLSHTGLRMQKVLLGFAAGVMLAASVWSLIIPAFDEAGTEFGGVLTVSAGFLLGCILMLMLDRIIPHQHNQAEAHPEGPPSKLSRPMLLVVAVALHNIPEGLSLGIVLHAALSDQSYSTVAAITFGLGLALQNFPEGIAVVMPLRQLGIPEAVCRRFGAFASLAEPVAALLAWGCAAFLAESFAALMPLLLSIAAGAMVFIVVEELIPESQTETHDHLPTYGLLAGFWLMAVMGVVAG